MAKIRKLVTDAPAGPMCDVLNKTVGALASTFKVADESGVSRERMVSQVGVDLRKASKRAGHPEEFTIVLLQTYKATCRIIAEHWPFLSEFGYTPGEENR